MKKIAFYIDNMNRGGAQRVMTNLCEFFSALGLGVILINDYPSDGKRSTYEISESVKREYLQTKYERNPISNNFHRLRSLRKILTNEKPDVILSFLGGPNIRALLATIGMKQKVVISVRNDPNREYASGGIKKAFVRKLFNRAHGCVFQTEDARAYFSENLQKKAKVIFNPVDYRFYKILRSPNQGEIVTAGRMNDQKRHDLLINAFARVVENHPDVRLIIYGEGPLRNKLEEQIQSLGLQDKVYLAGNVSDLDEKYTTASTFVLSSDYEGMPNALMEAMAAGVPCISTDCPCGGPRVLDGGTRTIRLVKVGDVEALSQAICEIIDDPSLMVQMGDLAKKRAELFKPEKIFEEWNNYLSTVVEMR